MSNQAGKHHYDVLIAGGGSAGVCAAVQVGRAGGRALLVEKNGMLGGTTTVGGVNFPGLFHAWGRQVIAGIGWQLIEQTVALGGAVMPGFSKTPDHHAQHQVRVNVAVYSAVCDRAVIDSGATLMLHTMVASVAPTDGRGWRVELCTKGGLRAIDVGVIVDCTADANVAGLAGAELVKPPETQPGTLAYRVAGYDFDSLDLDAINAALAEAIDAGEVRPLDFSWNPGSRDMTGWLRRHAVQANHIITHHADTSEGRTRAELDARASMMRMVRFARAQRGLENLVVDWSCNECGVRETARIVGDITITGEDYVTGRAWPDSVCHGFYPIDVHNASEAHGGLDIRKLNDGIVPTVPRAALLARGIDNVLAAGRCISADREALSALRVQATAMATGQAAGALAYLAAATGQSPRDLAMDEIRALLEQHGAIVPSAGA